MKSTLDYQHELDLILDSIKKYASENKLSSGSSSPKKPTLLLHACCAPCSSYVLEYLSSLFDITIYYYNPNIHPIEEYTRRLQELKKFLIEFPSAKQNNVTLIEASYNSEEFFEATNVRSEIALQTEPERGERCRRCYLLRMKKAYEFAKANSFDYFTTTLSISPYKDSKMINEIGYTLIPTDTHPQPFIPNSGLHYLPADFKKKNGFLRSLQLSSLFNLYRQDYCGCIYSKQNMHHSTTTL